MSARPRSGAAGLVLAAGASHRFGSPKQLASFRGRPLLAHSLDALTSARSLEHRFVVLGACRDEILSSIELRTAEPVACERWRDGQSAALRAGIRAAASAGAPEAVVLLGDQPLVSDQAVDRVVEAFRAHPRIDAARAHYGGAPGHPVLLASSLYDAVEGLSGDAGARDLLATAEVLAVDCDELGDPIDVDTPEDLLALEAATGAGRP
jgi:molybdenum cofactor cytidylyltransferase